MPNDVWTMDIIHDSCMNGTKLRILSIVDEFTRECLALEVSIHINSNTVRSVLSRLFTTRAFPRFLRSDNGGEFVARFTALLLHEAKCTARFIQPGKPWQNGFIESFHSTLRRDHLDVEVFFNLLDAQLKTGIYRNLQPSPTTLGTGLQSTNRICNNNSRIPNVATGIPNGGRPL